MGEETADGESMAAHRKLLTRLFEYASMLSKNTVTPIGQYVASEKYVEAIQKMDWKEFVPERCREAFDEVFKYTMTQLTQAQATISELLYENIGPIKQKTTAAAGKYRDNVTETFDEVKPYFTQLIKDRPISSLPPEAWNLTLTSM